MRRFAAVVLAAALAAPLIARAAPPPDINTPINDFIDGFNQGDTKRGFGAYAPGDVVIIDEFPPHIWTGAQAAQTWAADYGKYIQTVGVSDGSVAHGAPSRVAINGNLAYVLVPAVYSYKSHGTPTAEKAEFTFVLAMADGAWKIKSWTYAGATPHPAQ
jgi:hypothetical protein